jgi:GNAT superfamily N-acetyltransferase
METEESVQPIFSHAEPVLAVHNVSETIMYWQEVLGFPSKWTWGEPPTHGAVSWQKAFIQFSQNSELARTSKGNSVWIRVQHIKVLYALHQKKNADIISPLKNQPWGMAQYTVRDINGYFLDFAGMISEREKSAAKLSENIKIIERLPTIEEYRGILSAVGWTPSGNAEVIAASLTSAVYAVVAINTVSNQTIGCALLLGDKASFYYVKDVMVLPEWQSKRVGTAMMKAITDWLEKHASNNSLAALITNETLEPFYQQFGFAQAFSMIRYIQQSGK